MVQRRAVRYWTDEKGKIRPITTPKRFFAETRFVPVRIINPKGIEFVGANRIEEIRKQYNLKEGDRNFKDVETEDLFDVARYYESIYDNEALVALRKEATAREDVKALSTILEGTGAKTITAGREKLQKDKPEVLEDLSKKGLIRKDTVAPTDKARILTDRLFRYGLYERERPSPEGKGAVGKPGTVTRADLEKAIEIGKKLAEEKKE